jgi:hypothetical protein
VKDLELGLVTAEGFLHDGQESTEEAAAFGPTPELLTAPMALVQAAPTSNR